MRSLFYILAAVAVMGFAFWAYQENYKTQKELKQTARLNAEIGRLRETLGMLRAEWAYLNRPSRLQDLAERNFNELGLLPLSSDQFARIDQVAFPPRDLGPLDGPVDVAGALETNP